MYSGSDFNGDGKDDIIDLNHDDADVYLSTGASFEQTNHMFDAMEDMVKVAIMIIVIWWRGMNIVVHMPTSMLDFLTNMESLSDPY